MSAADWLRPRKPVKYPWSLMSVGGCFFAPGESARKLANDAYRRQKRSGDVYRCKTMVFNGVTGVRVTRVI
jgi:hypothetical protein